MKMILPLLFTIFLITNSAFAFPNEPDGFRSLKWGDSVDKFKTEYKDVNFERNATATELFSKKQQTYAVYTAKLGNRKLSNIDLQKYGCFLFKDDKLIGVLLRSKEYKSVSDFKKNQSDFLENLTILYSKYNRDFNRYEPNLSKKVERYIWDDSDKSVIMVDSVTDFKIDGINYIEVSIFDINYFYKVMTSTFDQKDNAKEQGW